MGRKKTRAKELARRWRKKKHLRQKNALWLLAVTPPHLTNAPKREKV